MRYLRDRISDPEGMIRRKTLQRECRPVLAVRLAGPVPAGGRERGPTTEWWSSAFPEGEEAMAHRLARSKGYEVEARPQARGCQPAEDEQNCMRLSRGRGPVPRVRASYRGSQGLAARDADHARLCGTARGRHHASMPVRLRADRHQGRAEPDGRTVQVMRMPMRKEERKEGCHGR